MARFCANCGAPVAEGVSFCGNCGHPQAAGAAPAAAPQTARSGGFPKVLLIIGGMVVLFGGLAVAGLLYTGYRIKKAVQETASEKGLDLVALAEQGKELPAGFDPCEHLSSEEAGEILGVSMERSEREGNVCNYYAPAVSEKEKQEQVEEALRKLKEQPEGKGPAGGAVEELTKSMVAAAAGSGTPFLVVTYEANGKAKMAAMKLALGALGGRDSAQTVPGLGDEALFGPMSSILLVVHNGIGIEIDLRQVAGGRDKGIELARRIVGSL